MYFEINNLKKKNIENFADHVSDEETNVSLYEKIKSIVSTEFGNQNKDNMKNMINDQYNMDIEAIRNLGAISKSLLTGINYNDTTPGTPGELTIPANTKINGNLLVDGGVTFTKRSQFNIMEFLPAGIILAYNSVNPPTGWAICNGLNGTPDLRGRFILGSGRGNRPFKSSGGAETHTLTAAQMPYHTHTQNPGTGSTHFAVAWGDGAGNWANQRYGMNSSQQTGPAGSTQAHNNMPPYYVLTYIIKL